MILKQRLAAGLNKIIDKAGTQIRVQYFTSTIGSVYDDDVSWNQSGLDLWTSGIILPLNVKNNSSDSVLLEQGKLLNDDKRLFVHGSLVFTGSEMLVSIRAGSPGNEIDNQYSMLAFSKKVDISNTPIYKQVYMRGIGGIGSILGEV